MSGFQYEPDHRAPSVVTTQQQRSRSFHTEQSQKKRRPKSPIENTTRFVANDVQLFFTPLAAVWEAFRKNLRP